MAAPEKITVGDETYDVKDVLSPWLERVSSAKKVRDEFLPQIRVNRKFAAGKQHLDVNPRDGRVIDVRYRSIGGVNVKMVTSPVLDQYLNTAIGRMSANDYRPNFMAAQEDENSVQITQQMNDAFKWGWDNEWEGDRKVLSLLRLLVVDGTAAVRCRYDRKYGEIVGDFPYKDGRPIMDTEEARKYVAEKHEKQERVAFSTIREGKVCWEVLSVENFLTPPGSEYPEEFPWVVVVRPVNVAEIYRRYGDFADGVQEDEIESSSSLTSGLGFSEESKAPLSGKALVYTGYEKPTANSKKGRTVVFTSTNLLDFHNSMPLDDHPRGPTHGVHFFRWQAVPGRFYGKAFIENGIGSQSIRNKRLTQIDTIIDRNMPKVFAEEQSLAVPKTGEPMEVIPIRPGAPLPQVSAGVAPGQWMLQDIKQQDDNIEKSMGMRSISLGQPPQGVSAYSAMALLSENDSLKLDPISQELKINFTALAWDTMEAMRNWPKNKQMEISGPSGSLRSFLFSSNQIPARYIVDVPKQGSLPRSAAAELQKINDIWTAAQNSQKPLPLEWYVTSLNAGKAQELPANLTNVSKHKAELENIVMFHSKENIPVSPEDDDLAHVEIHRVFQQQMRAMADMGEEDAERVWQALETHCQEHLRSAQDTTMQAGPEAPQQPGQTPGPMGATPGSPSAGTRGAGVTAPPGSTPPIPGIQ